MNEKLNGYYAKVYGYTQGMKLRDWLDGQSFEVQYQYGIKALKDIGAVK
jgi:hypothetical protein